MPFKYLLSNVNVTICIFINTVTSSTGWRRSRRSWWPIRAHSRHAPRSSDLTHYQHWLPSSWWLPT